MSAVSSWFQGGGPVMPALLAVGLILYTILIERVLAVAFGRPLTPEGLAPVRALIAAAPLLGLLGTVSGLIESFSALMEEAQVREIGVGIGHALRTTQYGIALAAPALLFERTLSRWTAPRGQA